MSENLAASNADLLIRLGRDREAAEAARRQPTDGAQQLDVIIPMLEAIVDRISADQLGGPTPCAGFTVTGVLEHMIGGATAFAPAFRGEPAPSPSPAGAIAPRFHDAMASLRDAVHAPGALDRTVAAPFGEVPGAVFARFVAFDGLVHGWDLSVATGQPYDPPADLVAEVDAFAREALTPAMRDGDTFTGEKPVAADATPIERLVAFTGRTVPETRVPDKERQQ